ncbi:MAG: alanine--glyoxylate aminotransferase family protein [archaeon]|nr:MAG: alanine--glyoxylate aminotransferase family protein [archaeon]
MPEKLLLIPGPTNVSEVVRKAMSGPQLPHVGAEFYATFKEIIGLSRQVFRNEKGVQFVFTGSGTIGMESSVTSLVSRGDRTLTLSSGYFGKRMLMLNQIHGAVAESIDYPEGGHADPDDLRKKLKGSNYSAVFMTHVDTSTSVANPIKELVAECNAAGVLSVVDCVCSIGGLPLEFDKLGADIVFTASQKALAAAPGAVLLAASDRAIQAMERRESPIESYYMSLLRWKPVMEDPRMYLATPATQVLQGLRQALSEVMSEGLDARWARHRKLGELAREFVSAHGFGFVADEGYRSDTVTSIWVKDGMAGPIQKTMESDHGVVLARGIYEAKDKMIRIGHFGNLQPDVLEAALASLDATVSGLASAEPVQMAERT